MDPYEFDHPTRGKVGVMGLVINEVERREANGEEILFRIGLLRDDDTNIVVIPDGHPDVTYQNWIHPRPKIRP